MSDPFLGEIKMFGGNFAPRGYAFCSGQLLSIAQYSALFSILGTTYGGDGRTTFGLPDLRGRSPVHSGNGPGLPTIRLGEKSGAPTTTLTVANLPPHSHTGTATLKASGNPADTDDPSGNHLGLANAYSTQAASVDMASGGADVTTNATGSGAAVNNYHPYQGIHFIIALAGTFPTRS